MFSIPGGSNVGEITLSSVTSPSSTGPYRTVTVTGDAYAPDITQANLQFNITIEGSLDNVNWFTIDTFTSIIYSQLNAGYDAQTSYVSGGNLYYRAIVAPANFTAATVTLAGSGTASWPIVELTISGDVVYDDPDPDFATLAAVEYNNTALSSNISALSCDVAFEYFDSSWIPIGTKSSTVGALFPTLPASFASNAIDNISPGVTGYFSTRLRVTAIDGSSDLVTKLGNPNSNISVRQTPGFWTIF